MLRPVSYFCSCDIVAGNSFSSTTFRDLNISAAIVPGTARWSAKLFEAWLVPIPSRKFYLATSPSLIHFAAYHLWDSRKAPI